jgi:putative peptidoglycan lipid II flippase
MVAGTVVTLISLPIYAGLYRVQGAAGLAVASDVGIALQTVLIAVLLHKRRMVSLASLDLAEMGRCLFTAIAAGTGAALLAWTLGSLFGHWHSAHLRLEARLTDLAILVAGSALWLAVTKWMLEKSGSALPRVAMKRLRLR